MGEKKRITCHDSAVSHIIRCMRRPTTLDAALERGDQIVVAVDELLKRRQSHSGQRRTGLVLAYISIVEEHHLAFLLLVRSNYFGSAMALVRPQIDSLIRMLWIARCATDDQVKDIWNKIATNEDHKFPCLRQMTDEIDSTYVTGGFFSCLKKNAWKLMCDFTHTGVRQIRLRFKGKTIEPNYSPQAMLAATNMVNAAMLMAAGGFFELMGYEDELTEVKLMMYDYDMVDVSVH